MYFPRFRITNKLLKQIDAIAAAREAIESSPLIPIWEVKLRQEAEIKQIYFGLKLTGNDLSQLEVEKIIREEPLRSETADEIAQRVGVSGRERDVQEVIDYRNAFKIVEQWALLQQKRASGISYNREHLMQIETLMLEKLVDSADIGNWRKGVVHKQGMQELGFRPPNAVEVPYQMDDLFLWLAGKETRDLHPVLKAAVVYFELLRIQPFIIGNERVADLVMNWILMVEGINGRRLIGLGSGRNKTTKEFYQVLGQAVNQGDLTYWIEYFAAELLLEMEQMREKVKRLSVDTQVRGKIGQQIALNERQIKLIEFMETREWMTMNEARQVLAAVSDDTILRDLKDLIKKDLVKKKGQTKGARYALKHIIR